MSELFGPILRKVLRVNVAGILFVLPCLVLAQTIYVSTTGNDSNKSGTVAEQGRYDGPFRTLERARDAIRLIQKLHNSTPTEPLVVLLQPGVYRLSSPFILNLEDSGSAASPITYRASKLGEVRITGGQEIGHFIPVTDKDILRRLPVNSQGKVWAVDLTELGIVDTGRFHVRGFSNPSIPSPSELFVDQQPMKLARWPSDAFAKIVDLPEGPQSSKFTFACEHSALWEDEPEVWAHGYWFEDWADELLRIYSVDVKNCQITLSGQRPQFGLKAGQRFYLENLLSELAQPGEWYLDRRANKLYFWPLDEHELRQAELSVKTELLRMNNVSFVKFSGIVFDEARGTAITIDGGTHNTVDNCVIRNTGNLAIQITGVYNGISNCLIENTGGGGVSLLGGDRQALVPANLYANNNTIRNYARLSRAYRPAIRIYGVGNIASHNLVYDGPHAAIIFSGNDHVIEFNDIHHIAYETSDVGAIYTGRDWTARGTQIRYNYLHEIGGEKATTMGIYLDDQASGTTIYGNIFNKVNYSVFIGGGRDNVVENNIFTNCAPCIHLDNRGVGWQKEMTDDPNGTLRRNLMAVPYQSSSAWHRYPHLANIMDDELGAQKYNAIIRNVFAFGDRYFDLPPERNNVALDGNVMGADDQFLHKEELRGGAAVTRKDFELKENASAYQSGFKPIQVDIAVTRVTH